MAQRARAAAAGIYVTFYYIGGSLGRDRRDGLGSLLAGGDSTHARVRE